MECLPAIDLREGRSVRLLRGSFDAETVYGDPVEQAIRYEKAGATMLHLVDLDAARTGTSLNGAVIAEIATTVAVPLEVGGGIRSVGRVEAVLSLGVARVVLGTRAVEEPNFACELAARFPGRIAVGLDYRRSGDGRLRKVAVRGWERESGAELIELVGRFSEAPLAAVIATDIGRDGTLEGPDLAGYRYLLEATSLPVIASGGVGTLGDLRELAALRASQRGLAGAIVGKALVEGTFSIEEAVAACAR